MAMKYPNVIGVQQVIESAESVRAILPNGKRVPARPLGYASFPSRLRAAWLVFTGKADALTWPGQ